jgi:hypothetical protein
MKKMADPLQFLSEKPFCAYPQMWVFIESLKLSAPEQEKLLIELHRFEHKLLVAGYELYSTEGRDLGAKVLDRALAVFAEEYPKWKEKNRP